MLKEGQAGPLSLFSPNKGVSKEAAKVIWECQYYYVRRNTYKSSNLKGIIPYKFFYCQLYRICYFGAAIDIDMNPFEINEVIKEKL